MNLDEECGGGEEGRVKDASWLSSLSKWIYTGAAYQNVVAWGGVGWKAKGSVLISTDCHNNRLYTELKQHKLTSNSSRSWEIRDQVASHFGFWEERSSWLVDGHLLTVFSPGRESASSLVSLLKRALIPSELAPPL